MNEETEHEEDEKKDEEPEGGRERNGTGGEGGVVHGLLQLNRKFKKHGCETFTPEDERGLANGVLEPTMHLSSTAPSNSGPEKHLII